MKYIRRIILSLLLVAIWFTMRSPGAGEAYARNIYPYVSAVLSRFSSLFPFSVGDCLIYGSIVGLLVYVGCAIAGKCSWKTLAGRTVEYLLWVYVWFYMAWGLNYFRQDFFTRTQLPYAAYSADAFRSFLSAYTDALNASFVFSTKLSYNSSLTRLIVQPPNPPPITREPVTPYSLAQSFRKSSSSQLTSYSLLKP